MEGRRRLGASFAQQVSAASADALGRPCAIEPALKTRKGCTFVHANSDAGGWRPTSHDRCICREGESG